MSARSTVRQHDRLLLIATVLAAAAVLLRLVSPGGEPDAKPTPPAGPSTHHRTHTPSPTDSTHHRTHTPSPDGSTQGQEPSPSPDGSTHQPKPSASPTRSTDQQTPSTPVSPSGTSPQSPTT